MVEQICGLCGSVPSVDNPIGEWWFGVGVDPSKPLVKKWYCLHCQLSEIPAVPMDQHAVNRMFGCK